ncbi:MAG: hypothetical protein ACXWTS_05465 [Methylococcaceae bacterium]
MQQNLYQTFIYTSLPCEAKPLVDHFSLKKNTTIEPFAVYCHRDICLTVTGIGKSAMAAGVAYTQALFASASNPVLLNIGIAGHKDHALGELFLIDKMTDFDSRRNYYPSLVFTPTCATAAIQTVSRPQLDYNQPYLYDMEASAFYETAVRFSSAELIQCLKVISDNKASPVENIQPKQVTALIAAHVLTIETLLTQLRNLARRVTLPEPGSLEQLLQRYHFTASEKMQLKNQLSRWAVASNHHPLEYDETPLHRGKDVLRWLDQHISKLDFYL